MTSVSDQCAASLALCSPMMGRDHRLYQFRLAYRPPYDWDAVLAFLSARATLGQQISAERALEGSGHES